MIYLRRDRPVQPRRNGGRHRKPEAWTPAPGIRAAADAAPVVVAVPPPAGALAMEATRRGLETRPIVGSRLVGARFVDAHHDRKARGALVRFLVRFRQEDQ